MEDVTTTWQKNCDFYKNSLAKTDGDAARFQDERVQLVMRALRLLGIGSIPSRDILLLLKVNLDGQGDRSPHKVGRAFHYLERYALNLYFRPWKKDYHVLKKYCGYYKSKVEVHLKGAEVMLFKLGYHEDHDGMTWRIASAESVDRRRMLEVAFYCLVAAVECGLSAAAYLELGGLCTLRQVFQARIEQSCSIDNTIANLRMQMARQAILPPASPTRAGSKACDSSRSEVHRASSPLHVSPSKATQLWQRPLATASRPAEGPRLLPPSPPTPPSYEAVYDDLLEPATADEHMEMSLRFINEPPPPAFDTSNSVPVRLELDESRWQLGAGGYNYSGSHFTDSKRTGTSGYGPSSSFLEYDRIAASGRQADIGTLPPAYDDNGVMSYTRWNDENVSILEPPSPSRATWPMSSRPLDNVAGATGASALQWSASDSAQHLEARLPYSSADSKRTSSGCMNTQSRH